MDLTFKEAELATFKDGDLVKHWMTGEIMTISYPAGFSIDEIYYAVKEKENTLYGESALELVNKDYWYGFEDGL